MKPTTIPDWLRWSAKAVSGAASAFAAAVALAIPDGVIGWEAAGIGAATVVGGLAVFFTPNRDPGDG